MQSDPAYIDGLRQGDLTMLETIYLHFRHPIVQVIREHGGSAGDGAVFFRTAISEAARGSETQTLPEDLHFGDYLKSLALAHYKDWLLESEKEIPETLADLAAPEWLPPSNKLRETRGMIFAHRLWDQTEPDCKQRIHDAASSAHVIAPLEEIDPCISTYLESIQVVSSDGLPDFAKTGITDPLFTSIRDHTKAIEIRLAKGDDQKKPAPAPASPLFRNLFIGLILSTLAVYAYQWLTRPKDVKEIFTNNFDAPKSLVADAAARMGKNLPTEGDSIGYEERPVRCDQILEEADVYYQRGDYKAAASMMYELADNPDLSPCHSDAYFYLGILAIHLNAPNVTLQSFAKIEDLERFGEDIYWFQALAYVQMATEDASMRDIALRAIQRAQDNTAIETRRQQTEKMIADLSAHK